MKHLSLLALLLAFTASPSAQTRTIRCLVLNSSHEPPRPEPKAKITPLSGGNTLEQGTEAGIFELKIPGAKPGQRLELLVGKDGYRILGPNAIVFTYAVPESEAEIVQIAIIKNTDFDSRKADYEKAIEKRIREANAVLLDLIARLQTQQLSEDERTVLTKFVSQQNIEIETLRKGKEELAARLAQVDLDQASEFAKLALKKFREEGDVKAALALMPDEKLDEFWENMRSQEEKVKRARQQGVENYMIRARLLAADKQFDAAYKNYLEATEKDSLNLANLWEVAGFFVKQNQDQRAIALYERCLALSKTDADRAGLLNNLGNLYSNNQKKQEAKKAYDEALSIRRKLAKQNPDAFLPDVAMTLNNLGNLYIDNQKMPEAKKAYDEALGIYRKLEEKNPDAFLPNLATTLYNLGTYYHENQKMPEAEKTYDEALGIYRKLEGKNPDAFQPDLAYTLNSLGIFYHDNQKMPEAEKAYGEALSIRRKLVEKNPDAFQPDLATTLNNLGILYRDNQKMPEAENAYDEALSIRRKLVEKNPDAFLSYLAATLNNLGNLYSDNKKMQEAKKAYDEALSIRRKLAKENPDVFNDDLSSTLNNLAYLLLFVGKPNEAIPMIQEALQRFPKNEWVMNNLALAYLLDNQFDKAKQIFLDYKDKPHPWSPRFKTYKDASLFCLDELGKAGVSHPDIQKIRMLLNE